MQRMLILVLYSKTTARPGGENLCNYSTQSRTHTKGLEQVGFDYLCNDTQFTHLAWPQRPIIILHFIA